MSYIKLYFVLNESQKSIIKSAIDIGTGFTLSLSNTQISECSEEANDNFVLSVTSRQYNEYTKAKELGMKLILKFHMAQVADIAKNNYNKEVAYNATGDCKRQIIRGR